MLAIDKLLRARLSKIQWKLDAEGGKWVTFTLTMKPEAEDDLKTPLVSWYRQMISDTSANEFKTEQKMEYVQLEFQNGAGTGPVTTFVPKELFGFQLNRESSTQAGTLKKDRGAGVEVEFRFTVGLAKESGVWGQNSFGNDVTMTIYKTQGSLLPEEPEPAPVQEPLDPDSQEARNQRIIDEEQKDAAKPVEPISADEPVKEKSKRGRPKKKAA